MEEWKEYKLGEVVIPVKDRIETSCLDSTSYISTENMLPEKAGITLSSGVPSGNAVLFKKNDVLISNIRPYFKKIWRANRDGGCSADVICLRASNVVDPLFLYYLLSQDLFFDYVMQGAKGTKMPRGDRNQIMQWPVLIPSKNEQHNIASILSTLDDKIEVNRRINENLEQQAQALYKSWFVDFEPFRDGEFVESELGMIPKGWRVVSLNDACTKITDGSHYSPKDNPNGTIPMLSVKDMNHNGFDYSSCKMIDFEEFERMKANDCVPLKSDILVAKDGSYLKEIFICLEEIQQAILSSIAIFRTNKEVIYPDILLQLLRSPNVRKDVGDNYVSGSALPRIVLKDFKKYKFIVAPIEVQNRLYETLRSIYRSINCNEQESRRLATLRDTLLPKLMSGELKVNDVD